MPLRVRTVSVVLPRTVAADPHRWVLQMEIPYGGAADQLGLSDSHGGRTASVGPEYGAPAADGSWWFLDLAKRRLAHYSSSGSFLGGIAIPGRYVGLQALHVFADGTMWAAGDVTTGESMVSDGQTARRVTAAGTATWVYDDGRKAYGVVGRGQPVPTLEVIDGEPVVGHTDWMRSPNGQRFAAYLADPRNGPLTIELPDAATPARLVLPYRAGARPLDDVLAVVEAEADAHGTIDILLFGATEGLRPREVAGFLTVTASGQVTPVVAVPRLTSAADPGAASHLHIDPATNTPTLVVVADKALRVFRLAG